MHGYFLAYHWISIADISRTFEIKLEILFSIILTLNIVDQIYSYAFLMCTSLPYHNPPVGRAIRITLTKL